MKSISMKSKILSVVLSVALCATMCCGVIAGGGALTGCTNSAATSGDFSAWNDGATALNNLKSYVQSVTDKNSADYIPPEDRIACFDMDGVIYCETAPTAAFFTFFAYRVLQDPEFKDKATDELKQIAQTIMDAPNNKITEDALWNQTGLKENYSKVMEGMTVEEFDAAVDRFKAQDVTYYNNATYGDLVFKPIAQVIDYLNANEFSVYVNTGSSRFMARDLLKNSVNVDTDKVIGADASVSATGQGDKQAYSYVFKADDNVMIGDLTETNVNSNKVFKNIAEIGKTPCVVFGNSSTDTSMHTYTQAKCKYKTYLAMVLADDAEREVNPQTSKAEKYKSTWQKAGYEIISTKDDYKILFGENITKK